MPATATLAQMRERARDMSDMQTSSQSQAFITDAELDRIINRHLKSLYQKLITLRGDDYYATQTTFPSVANQATYAVPNNFFQLLKLIVSDGTRYWTVPRYNLEQWADLRYLQNVSSSDLTLLRYRLTGANIEVRPAPKTAGYTFTLFYLPAFAPLVNAGDTFDGVNGWEDWACYGAAIDMLIKEESMEQAAALQAQRQTLDQQIDALAGNRDAGRPEVVGDNMKDWADMGVYNRRNDWNW